jgi:hypothetical protein
MIANGKPSSNGDGGSFVRIADKAWSRSLRRAHRDMLMILEDYCGEKPGCWHGNPRIASDYGRSVGQVARVLAEMEAGGLIWRVMKSDVSGTHRVAIFLRKRLDASRPVVSERPSVEHAERLRAGKWDKCNHSGSAMDKRTSNHSANADATIALSQCNHSANARATIALALPVSRELEPENEPEKGNAPPHPPRGGERVLSISRSGYKYDPEFEAREFLARVQRSGFTLYLFEGSPGVMPPGSYYDIPNRNRSRHPVCMEYRSLTCTLGAIKRHQPDTVARLKTFAKPI